MAYADESTYMGPNGDGSIIGAFIEEDHCNRFEFSHNPDFHSNREDVHRFLVKGSVFGADIPHLVWVVNEGHFMRKHMSGFRYAKVLKTRAWVLVDEDLETGEPIWECWKFKNAKCEIYDRRHYGEYVA